MAKTGGTFISFCDGRYSLIKSRMSPLKSVKRTLTPLGIEAESNRALLPFNVP